MRKLFRAFDGRVKLQAPLKGSEAKDLSVEFLGEVGKGRSIEDYVRELEVHRWELEHRVNQLADHLSVAKKSDRPPSGGNDPVGLSTGSSPLVDIERDRHRNASEAKDHPDEVAESNRRLASYLAKLASMQSPDASARVPEIFHFVYGIKDSGDLPYYGYLAIRSAMHFNPGWRVILHAMHVPVGPCWDRIKDHVVLVTVQDFVFFKNAHLHHYAHKADVIRLLAMTSLGGVYLDIDTITRKSFDDLRDADFCMGVQAAGANSASGLCNAVMIGQPGAAFSSRWLAQYDYFRSKGRDDLWDYHSVKLPGILMATSPESLRVLDYRAFFYPLWETIEQQLFTNSGHDRFHAHFDDAYCFHLWNGGTGRMLNALNESYVRSSGSIYARIAREVEAIGPL